MPPEGITIRETIYGILFELVYFGFHLIGWNFVFPTVTEKYLWRAASLTLLGLLLSYLVMLAIGHRASRPVARYVFNTNATTILEVAGMLPKWAKVAVHLPIVFCYTVARAYILLEGFTGLRALPSTLYVSVEWTQILPHL
jgi:phosphoglycerol transferase MdoB-like AlkP superfamily enzyme